MQSLHLIPDNHANIPKLSFLQAGCPSCRPTNSVKALKAKTSRELERKKSRFRPVKVELDLEQIAIKVF